MVANAGLKLDLGAVASEVARALSHAEVQGNAAFVSTAVSYPNGTSCVVRIDEDPDGYFVSDDGYGAFTAETMGGLPSFNKVAQISAQRWGVKFDHRSFFVLHVSREQLAGAVVAIANTSVSAVERTVYAMDAIRIRRSREIFIARVSEAFGQRARFDVDVRGGSGTWQFDAIVEKEKRIGAVIEFVSPAYSAVASANLKLGDVKAMHSAPIAVAALADYEKTDPSLRSILASSADYVIAANDDIMQYRRAG